MWRTAFKIDITDELAGWSNIEVHACATCDLRFFLPALAGGPNLYAQLQRFDWYYMPRRWEHQQAIQDLRGLRTAVEIGSGLGDFVEQAQQEAGTAMVGIEINAEAAAAARALGRDVHTIGLGEQAAQLADGYDAVCSFQVLEHVGDPRQFLDQACALIRPGGRLLLGVPNAGSFIQYQFNPLDMPPHHTSRWSEETMQFLPRIYPLRVLRIAKEPLAPYHANYFVDTLYDRPGPRGAMAHLVQLLPRQLVYRVVGLPFVRGRIVGQTLYAAFERL
jgi:SAM-dependent methyltransferase